VATRKDREFLAGHRCYWNGLESGYLFTYALSHFCKFVHKFSLSTDSATLLFRVYNGIDFPFDSLCRIDNSTSCEDTSNIANTLETPGFLIPWSR